MKRSKSQVSIALLLTGLFLAAGSVTAQVLASGELVITGARLEVSPASQEIDPGRPTVVHTEFVGVAASDVPAGLLVEGDLDGPGLDSPLHLTTVPGESFQIPGLNREGTFTLSGIRLTEDGHTLFEAVPSTVEIFVHRLVIASITSRPLTPEEIESYGIVIGDDNYTTWHYTVGFQLESGQVELPFDFLIGPDGLTPLELPQPTFDPLPNLNTEGPIPTVTVGALELLTYETPDLDDPDAAEALQTVVPAFLVFPTDIAFLNQFFSAIIVVQNGALVGSGIELHNLSAVLEANDGGLRQAETEPPTIPGEPVAIVDPGPDGESGTGDDLTFILAQSRGEATWLLEGLSEGQHRVNAHLTGEIHGLASGEPEPIEGSIPGVVVVRDPRFSMTFFHPRTVRAGEHYEFKVVVANTSTTPVYDLSLRMPGTSVSGAQILSDEMQSVAQLLPGTSAMVTWDMLSLETGRVIASGFNTSNPIEASFNFEMGVGELGIPLSPESLVLPSVVDLLPESFVAKSLELLGLAYSLANAPNGADINLPPVGEAIVTIRAAEMAAAARRFDFGESLERAMMGLGLEWLGTETWSQGWDTLRRASVRGQELESYLAQAIDDHLDNVGVGAGFADFEEVAITGRPMLVVYAGGAGYEGSARLRLTGLTSGKTAVGQTADTALFSRDLPGAAVLEVAGAGWSGEIGVVAVPADDEGTWLENGYRVELLGAASGEVTFQAVIVMPDGTTRRFSPSMAVATADGSTALIDITPDSNSSTIFVDFNGDQVVDASEVVPATEAVAPEPRLISAIFDASLNTPEGGPYDDLILLFSQSIDESLISDIIAEDWTIDSHLELSTTTGETFVSDRRRHGALIARQADPAFLVLSVGAPLNPHAELMLSSGPSPAPFFGGRILNLVNEPISVGGDLGSGAVRGVVIGPDGNVVPSAQVSLYENVQRPGCFDCNWILVSSDRTTADTGGSFSFDAVRYRGGQIPSRYASFLIRAIDPATGHEALMRATLPADATVRDLTVFMVGRGDIVGTLRRADGAPLTIPKVFGRSVTNPEEYTTVVPDASGAFRLDDLPVGAIQVLGIDGQDYVYGTAVVPGPGQEGSIDLILQDTESPLAQVTGTVTDGETGAPSPGVQVYVFPAGAGGATHLATTNNNGEFAMADVPPGLATFKVWDPQQGRWTGTENIELIGDTTNVINIVTGQVVTGSVVGTVYRLETGLRTPLPGAYVISQSHARWTISDANGHYRLDDLVLGSVSLRANDTTTADSTNRTVELTNEGQEIVIDFDIESGVASGGIQVLVIDRSGNPIEGAGVAVERFGSGLEGTTGPDGMVVIEGVGQGHHSVTARYGLRLGRGVADVAFDGHVTDTTIIVGGTVSLSVETVADTSGGETTHVLSEISYRRPGISSSGKLTMLPEYGEFTCDVGDDMICHIDNLPEGVGNLAVVARNGFYGESGLSESLDPSDNGRLLTVNFSAPGSIAGRVVTEVEGEVVPLEGAWVELRAQLGDSGPIIPQQTITTGLDGTFFFDLISPGPFEVRTYSPLLKGLAAVGGTIQSAQAIEDLELLVRGPGTIEGDVAVCYGGGGAGETVQVTLEPSSYRNPFLADHSIPDLDPKHLELTLDENGSASFVFTELILGAWGLRVSSAVNGSAWERVVVSETGSALVLEDSVCLHPTGSVGGRVVFPETGEGASSVQVQLYRNGYYGPELLAADTTDEMGHYLFTEVPVGATFQTRAYAAADNRGGVSGQVALCDENNSGFGTTCFQDATLNIDLAGLGRIEGYVLSGLDEPIANAQVFLKTSVVVNDAGEIIQAGREYVGFSGPSGAYSFEGVPDGTITLKAFDPMSHLYAALTTVYDPVAEPVATIDLEMPETASVTVDILDPLGQPVGDQSSVIAFKQNNSTYFSEQTGGGTSVAHLQDGHPATFSGVVAGKFDAAACVGSCSSYDVSGLFDQQFGSALGGTVVASMNTPLTDQNAQIQLVGRADVDVRVTQGGNPVAGAEVRFNGSGHYGNRQLITQTDDNGAIPTIYGVGVGTYTASATLADGAGNTIGGSVWFDINQTDHGTLLQATIPLEVAGAVDGVIVDASGQPAVGALVKMTRPGHAFQSIVDGDGAFVFSALPVEPDYSVTVYAAAGAGKYSESGIGVVADSVTHLGTLQLDDFNPSVHGVSPTNGEQGVDASVDVVVEFSERMRHETLTASRIRLRRQTDNQIVATSIGIEDLPGDAEPVTRVTLTPALLESNTLYLVDVLQGVKDLGGRTLSFDAHFTFRTRDTEPPSVLAFTPSNDLAGANPVGPDIEPLVSFSEPVDEASVTPSNVRLLDAGGIAVAVDLAIERDGFDIRFRPLSALDLDAFYTIEVSGIADSSGNVMTEMRTVTFRIRDDQAPVVLLLPPQNVTVDGDSWLAVEGSSLILQASITSNDAVSTVSFAVDGVAVGSGVFDSGGALYRLPYTAPVGIGQRLLSVVAIDVSGNPSDVSVHALDIINDQAPDGVLILNPAQEIEPNHLLTVTVTGSDDFGLAHAYVTVTGAIAYTRTLNFSGTSDQVATSFRVPVTAAAGAQIVVTAEVEDSLGQRTALVPKTVTVLADAAPPIVTANQPADGEEFLSAATIDFAFIIEDNVEATTATLVVAGEPAELTYGSPQIPGSVWTNTAYATWIAPEVTAAETVDWTLTAGDLAGNTAHISGQVVIRPLVNPDAPVVTFVCPEDGDHVVAGLSQTVSFTLFDPNAGDLIQSYSVVVNGSPIATEVPVDQQNLSTTFDWIPSLGSVPGDAYELVIEARDYAGNVGSATITETVTGGTVLVGTQTIDATLNGQNIVLAGGTFTATEALDLNSLVVLKGTTLNTNIGSRLDLNIVGAVAVECGGSMDVTGKGYPSGESYEGTVANSVVGGNHLGLGGRPYGEQGTSYGSVYHPLEKGSGARATSDGLDGGGVISLHAASLDLEGDITADGVSGTSGYNRGGAGGSIWLRIEGAIVGSGTIRANGGTVPGYGSGGGGAVSIEHGNPSGELDSLTVEARGGWNGNEGGAGTVYVNGPGSVFGDLLVSNAGVSGNSTVLPALGNGVAGTGSGGDVLVVSPDPIEPYFVGHWIEISDVGGLKGTWRITSIDGSTITLEDADPLPSVAENDTWQGVYLFDTVTVDGGAIMTSVDPVRAPGWDLRQDGVGIPLNDGQPLIDPDKIGIETGAVSGTYRISVEQRAVTDDDGISEVYVEDVRRRLGVGADGRVVWPGRGSSQLSVTVIDNHPVVRFGRSVRLPALPDMGDSSLSLHPVENETCRLAAIDENLVVTADRSVRVFDVHDGQVLADFRGNEEVQRLAIGKYELVVGRRNAIELFDLFDLQRDPRVVPLDTNLRLIDLTVDGDQVIALIESKKEDGSRTFALALLSLAASIPELEMGPFVALDENLSLDRLLRTDTRLLVIATDSDPEAGQLVWSVPIGYPTGDPGSTVVLEPGTTVVGAWAKGMVVSSGSRVGLLGEDNDWTLVSALDLGAEVVSVATRGDRLLVLTAGSAHLLSLTDPSEPAMVRSINGIAHRAAVIGESAAVLFSPGFEGGATVVNEASWRRLEEEQGWISSGTAGDEELMGAER